MGEKNISRRSLMKMGGLAALGLTGAGALAACGGQPQSAGTPVASTGGEATATAAEASVPTPWLVAPEPITDFAETKEYDVVVVGAGAAGLPAALTAFEEGATVALLQKENQAVSQGSAGLGIDLATSDPAGVEAVVSLLEQVNQYRPRRDLLELWAQNSGEAVQWIIDKVTEAGGKVISQGNAQVMKYTDFDGAKVNYVSAFFGPKPYTNTEAMLDLAKIVEASGVEVFYSTPAEQLIVDESGAVTGVAAKTADGYVQFTARKGVILATGDYQNDEDMCDFYLPDIKNFARKQMNKTGDGHKMGCWAGGRIEPVGHTKMLHDFDAGPAAMCDLPFLAVDVNGNRFCCETAPMDVLNNFLKDGDKLKNGEAGWYSQVFDANYMTACADWPCPKLYTPEELENFMPDVEGEKMGVVEGFIRTFRADTLEELAEKIGADPTTFAATVKRYNELVASGRDDDFGKPAQFLKPIDTPPFYAMNRWLRVSAITSGLVVDGNLQVLNENDEPIGGLYAAGNVSGGFYGGIDYPMTLAGLSLGRCYTQGRYLGRMLANK